ncbi:type II toxin-antitoxin system RelE/ParE family toxin [Thioalkalivibrio sp. ALMg11]|uniref:type II toxin-antitoxin system RelE/ParE family toxin n=1 Tax=Thioalkalivibrio sp. ALMg11 TaxID=1158165 RepID=UPI00036F4644|nr:type II toxin-antitoxin system RelE/ParE family toxin [Thioalkalivibrio sp. ALMg11]
MPFHLSKKAEEDVISIFVQGAAEFRVEHAGRYHAALERQFQFLEDNPLVARERLEIDPPVRVHPFQAHIVVYTLDPGGDVYILRVRHAHEDWLPMP